MSSSGLASSSEIRYLQEPTEDDIPAPPRHTLASPSNSSETLSDSADVQRRRDAMRRERRKSATAFYSQPASKRGHSGSNQVAPAPVEIGGPMKGMMTQTTMNRYVKKYPHMLEQEIRGLEALFFTWDTDRSGEISVKT